MSRSRKWIMATAVASSTAALIGATGCWIGAVRYSDLDTARVAVGLSTLGIVLGLVYTTVAVLNCVEASHDKTRRQIDAALDRAGQRVADVVLLAIFNNFHEIAADQNAAAARLERAQHRWRTSAGTDTPIDLQQWRERATADGTTQS